MLDLRPVPLLTSPSSPMNVPPNKTYKVKETTERVTNNLDNCPIYIAVTELKYPESQYLNHQMFDRLSRLHFFLMVFEHQ